MEDMDEDLHNEIHCCVIIVDQDDAVLFRFSDLLIAFYLSFGQRARPTGHERTICSVIVCFGMIINNAAMRVNENPRDQNPSPLSAFRNAQHDANLLLIFFHPGVTR